VFSKKETYDPLEKTIKPAEMYWFILCHGKNIGSGIHFTASLRAKLDGK